MSIPHIMLVKLYLTGAGIEYRVECRDFNPDDRWDVVGSVVLVPELHIYEFQPTAIWRKKNASGSPRFAARTAATASGPGARPSTSARLR